MYKKLHNKETLPSWKPLYAKGFLFPCLPERGIMLTTFVYDIQGLFNPFSDKIVINSNFIRKGILLWT